MTDNTNIPELMHGIGEAAKDAARQLTTASTEAKNAALSGAAGALRRNQNQIMSENAKDMALGEDKGLTKAMLDRLTLDEGRIEAMAKVKAAYDQAGLKYTDAEIREDRTTYTTTIEIYRATNNNDCVESTLFLCG